MGTNISGVEGDRPAQVGNGRVTQGSQSSSSGAAPAVAETSSVHITETAGQLASLEQVVSQMPAVNEARVAAVRNAIDQGSYTISSGSIADNLLQFEQSLDSLGRDQQSP